MTAEYIPTEIGGGSSLKEEYERRELQQKRHYFLFSQLQNMARELPGKYQQRLPYDLLSSLANALIDGTVFQIVLGLREVQEYEEKAMFQQRSKLISDHKAQKHELQKKHKAMLQDCQSKPHNLALTKTQIDREMETTKKRCDEEIRKKDQKIIMQLDQKVMDQQSTLEKAGVQGFYVTNKPQDIRLQMYLLEFIVRLSQLEMPS
ncbi:protein DGCR6-like [Mercenaria mercenaria]|uniref:protein DGCR6-like n=1 Tax=Mercenaria mercenaria TaxID=6596 RepID=UPI00234F56BD|nr:protein DGCR6-like [Mercenaria mercenaria]XP_045197358.2 protein DGCR6-like [Mercenaria mercenaria]XP_053397517.1 protein DGCR6-like [Mercenaria mercenaria]XP_053397518.1 protein DGCR6-like [Mercenaria mercenaria]XP_053397519.1 protein DGCR6-like [Mercenaria mercenaria]XP_053397520.1 protein DGCR6-like [Mercenaria mercenaria]XP_053397521.1 protein DGCR6-like [Mercenaria mercenaria]